MNSENMEQSYSYKYIEQGRKEAWEAAKKLVVMDSKECSEVLGQDLLFDDEIFEVCTASEAIEKIRAYEEQKRQEKDEEIRVGDEVVNTTRDRGVVLDISNNDVFLFIPGLNIPQVTNKICCKKTGRTFPEIVEVLKKLQES